MDLIFITLVILFFAAFVKATFGFGESLLALPLLTLVLGLQVAVPLLALLAAAITLMLLARGWQRVDFYTTRRLLVGALIGVPVGVWGLKTLPVVWLTINLGLILIFVGGYNLTRPASIILNSRYWAYFFGFLAGALGGAYNIAAPPVVVYGTTQRWAPMQFRLSLQGFFLPLGMIILVSHAGAGLWTGWVFLLFALSFPVMLLAFWLGNRVSKRMTPQSFERFVYGGLIVLGILMLIQSIDGGV